MKRFFLNLSVITLFSCGFSCSLEEEQPGLQIVTCVYDFNESDHAWIAGFCDYPSIEYNADSYGFEAGYTDTPVPGLERKAFYISGNNQNEDLFMYLKKMVTGLEHDAQYTLTFEVQLATMTAKRLVDVGSPGESVFVKVGASPNEPKSVIDDSGNYVMNIDKGNHNSDGEDMIVIGNIAADEETNGFEIVTRSNSPTNGTGLPYDKPLIVKTNSKGELWLIVGTDSGFAGPTGIYYTSISAILSRTN